MAIKKGAFDLYTQERKLPEKRSVTNKVSHFFDDIDKESKTLESVHERFTINAPDLVSTVQQEKVKSQFTDLKKGSQTVHKRFTENDSDLISIVEQEKVKSQFTDLQNGSQMVHERFTENASDLISIVEQEKIKSQSTDLQNGSQTVHKCFIENASDIISIVEQRNVESQYTDFKNSSQTVHKRFTEHLKESQQNEKSIICFSKIIGIQRAVVIALYKNMKFNNSDTTNELTLEAIASLSGVNQKSLKNTLFRLNSAGVIFRADQKNGRSGWVKYKICPQIREEIQKNEFSILKK